jgi:hypothetical protein
MEVVSAWRRNALERKRGAGPRQSVPIRCMGLRAIKRLQRPANLSDAAAVEWVLRVNG